MNSKKNSMFLKNFFLICYIGFTLASCGIGVTNIGDITQRPRDFAGKEVTISGEVVDTFSLLIVKYFVVRDNSGEISVVTEKPLPVKGDKIKVKGTVQEAFSIGTKTALVLVESVKTN